MEKSSKRGKIPQSDWPSIMARYEAGETLASIARTYDCSPPAISYVVSRSRARQPAAGIAKPAAASEPQLIKAADTATAPAAAPPPAAPVGNGHPANGNGAAAEDSRPARPEPGAPAAWDRREPPVARHGNGHGGNGAERQPSPAGQSHPGAQQNAPRGPGLPQLRPGAPPPHTNGPDQRRTLHLSLGNPPNGNGGSPPQDGGLAGRETPVARGLPEIRTAFDEPVRRDAETHSRKDAAGTFIDRELRARVDGDIASFLAAFDAALLHDTQESRTALREATDRLLRAGARTRIELERLEARVPLPPRGAAASAADSPAWRQR